MKTSLSVVFGMRPFISQIIVGLLHRADIVDPLTRRDVGSGIVPPEALGVSMRRGLIAQSFEVD